MEYNVQGYPISLTTGGYPKLLGIAGEMGSGKDYIAKNLLSKYAPSTFAKPIKQIVQVLLRAIPDPTAAVIADAILTEREKGFMNKILPVYGVTLREFMQKIGTECFRGTFGDNFWAKIWESHLMNFLQCSSTESGVMVTDVREPTEVDCIHRHNGIVIRLKADAEKRQAVRPDYNELTKRHSSEQHVHMLLVDWDIENKYTDETLGKVLNALNSYSD